MIFFGRYWIWDVMGLQLASHALAGKLTKKTRLLLDRVNGVKMAFTLHGFEHMGGFEHRWAHRMTLYSVVPIAKDIEDRS